MGETLLARYVEADQDPEVAARVREHRRRHRLRQEYEAAYRAAHPDAGKVQLTKEQARECRWSSDGLAVRLRLETVGLDCDLHDALALTSLRDGDRLVVYPRWAVDERLPEADRKGFTPSPKQMLYGDRAELTGIVTTGTRRVGPDRGRARRRPAPRGVRRRVGQGLRLRGDRQAPGGRQALHARRVPERLVRALVPGGGRGPLPGRAQRPLRPHRPPGAVRACGDGAPGPGPVPGGAVRLPGRRAPARFRGEQAGLHRRPRPRPDPPRPGAAGHGQELFDGLRRLRPHPGGDAGRRGLSASSPGARPTPPPTC